MREHLDIRCIRLVLYLWRSCIPFFNSLALALFAVFALAIQMIVKFKNQYVAIVIPVILLYAITFAFDSVPLLLPYDIRIIIQPRSANAITEIVTKQDF